jgi:membrane protease YdiL (CAAX protease family)
MKHTTRKQLTVLAVALAIYAALAFITYLAIPLDQLTAPGQVVPAAATAMPRWVLASANAAIVLVAYGLLGSGAYWFALKLHLPGLYREGAGWRAWLVWPMVLGLMIGAFLVIGDRMFSAAGGSPGFPHPTFPLSIFASGSAGIGEEILARGFIFGLWGLGLGAVLRGPKRRSTALWIANIIAALAFGALHLPAAMLLLGATSPAGLPTATLAELFVLNGILGVAAGERMMRDGLVAAMGLHFWADVVWHVVWPVVKLGI